MSPYYQPGNKENIATSIPTDSPPSPPSRSIYAPKFHPTQIPTSHLTHLNYAFANVSPETGEIVLSDRWADVEIHHLGEPWTEGEGEVLYGNFAVLQGLKRRNLYVDSMGRKRGVFGRGETAVWLITLVPL